MFIIDTIKKEDATGKLKLLYQMIEKNLGFIPPHFELMATIDIKAMKDFLDYNTYMMTHTKIDRNLMPFLRLYIAQKECRNYCIQFNTQLLQNMGVNEAIISDLENHLDNIHVEPTQKILLKKVIKALYHADKFEKKDLETLYDAGFNDKDFYDILEYATVFMGKSKLIEVYHK
ncbi:hypothetical protein PGH07_06385 [Sulfurovum sp. zt1-1]|uniref:Carboxymuconolactone decarboxylase-like domain-containing protein n=1 Tax=Sulfurovum zhangzhouensis TaxID=3019067 RepID=A0ABT7QYE0_9BACT|nr:hypothetical protein [Sulfurovum zhangzhouensis]MDM5271798.1 hypothetical protein [Sulfurovum zhangzhouensis]